MDIKALREKVKRSMIDHLKTKGYPNLSIDDVLQELKPIWIKLEDEGLIQPGMNFVAFQQVAIQKALEHQTMDALFGSRR